MSRVAEIVKRRGEWWLLLTLVVFPLAVAAGIWWAFYHRGEVRILPFEGPNGTAVALQLARALDDVALGATSGLERDPSLPMVGDNGPPPVVIPGTVISFASLVSFIQVGPLAQTHVHGALEQRADGYQVTLQIFGPQVGERALGTDAARDPRDALVQSAESLYGVLDPIVQASYLYSRDPKRSLAIISDILSDSDSRSRDRATAYLLWGLVLRDADLDYEGAREKLKNAIGEAGRRTRGAQQFEARTWLEIGHSYLWEHSWEEAADAYKNSANLDTRWAQPHNFLGDTLLESGDAQGAVREYRQAIDLDPLYVKPWNGLGRAYMWQEQFDDAVQAYTTACRLHVRLDSAAASTYYGLGDTLYDVGCYGGASQLYERAEEIALANGEKPYGEQHPQRATRLTCRLPPASRTAAVRSEHLRPCLKWVDEVFCAPTCAGSRSNTEWTVG